MCPVGCHLTFTKKNGQVVVKGNACPRGEIFGKQEYVCPSRMVTTIMPYRRGTVSVKTTNPIPKNKIKDCLVEIKNCELPARVKLGQAVIKNVSGTSENVIITGIN